MKLNSKIDLFITDVCAGKHNETEKAYRTKLRQLEHFAADKPITERLIKGFIHDLKSRKTHLIGHSVIEGGLSQFTIRTVIQTMRHFLHWLYDNKHMRDDLYKRIKVPGVPPPMPKAISEDTFSLLLKSAIVNNSEEWERARDIAILFYLRDTGGRVGGLANVTLSNVDLKSGEINTVEKGKNVKKYINAPTIASIKVWVDIRQTLDPLTDHLFISKWSRQGLTRQGVTRMLNRLALMGGITDRHNAHSFRHAFARDFLKAGGEITQLAGIMNHSSIWVTTNYYARWNDQELHAAHTKNSPVNQINTTEV